MGIFDRFFVKNIPKKIKGLKQIPVERIVDIRLLKIAGDLCLKANENEEAARIYIILGDIYSQNGFSQKAISLYQQARKANPDWDKPYEKLATHYQLGGFVNEASTQHKELSWLIERTKNIDMSQTVEEEKKD
jgi:lipopolysaccharide biosynthesis regulator YciM